MPSFLDFDSTKGFRDFLIGKTLKQPNGPQTFNAQGYEVQNLSDQPNKDSGGVDLLVNTELNIAQTSNIYKPEVYFIKDNLDTLPRRANLSLYPYFISGDYTLLSILSTGNFETESELFKFAANYIKNDPNGPVISRIAQNTYQNTLGKDRLLDALEGNTPTAINIISGKEPLVESNYRITVDNNISIPAGVENLTYLTTGIESPISIIPGDILTNPQNYDNNPRPPASSESQALWQDATGAIGSLFGIQRRPTNARKPSDILIEYMGQGQRNRLFDLLSYSKYAPNYTTTARSQNTSKIFTFADQVAQNIKTGLGIEAPAGIAYIGDDRGEDVYYAMNDFYDRPVRSSYYLSFMFDSVSADLFHDPQKNKAISDGGPLAGELTWASVNSKNKIGANNSYSTNELAAYGSTISTGTTFRSDSILGLTQEILNTMPSNGGEARSHVANVIDQTSRLFIDGGVKLSRGNAVKYVSKFTGTESGIEYGRVWTKDRAYYSLGDTMPLNDDEPTSKYYTKTSKPYRRGNIRQYNGSVLDNTWNLNIYPVSNGKKSFNGSTNIIEENPGQGDFYAKKYMFSIENLAWKTSNRSGYTVNDLPYCERGPNGGRVMWFPPYDLKINEQNNATWEDNKFLGRPEPVYTYSYTQRSATISFKVVVDHPSILNLLIREHFKNMSDEEADNYINAFFGGIKDIDFYSLIQTYATLDKNDLSLIEAYLNKGATEQTIITNQFTATPSVTENKSNAQSSITNQPAQVYNLYFANAVPNVASSDQYYTTDTYTNDFNAYDKNATIAAMSQAVTNALTGATNQDKILLFNSDNPTIDTANNIINNATNLLNNQPTEFTNYNNKLSEIKSGLTSNTVQNVDLLIQTTASALGKSPANYTLSVRRMVSIARDVLQKLSKNNDFNFTPDDNLKKIFDSGLGNNLLPLSDNSTITLNAKTLGYVSTDPNVNPTINIKFSSEGEKPFNVDCTSSFSSSDTLNLKINSPAAIYCRHGAIKIAYNTISKETTNNNTPTASVVTSSPVATVIKSNNVPRPSIDVMKRIIMKTLSECYYFKKLEETSPIVFKSLKEKLKYFHPGFHSTTPEGLNSRLTFLLQCVRPGDTMPIKGISQASDLPARNTTFGPPPICVMRIGDFYHTKMVIRDININYDESPWDLNPEGIGIQPMLASVTLQVSLIGGHGLESPVDKLQNALSSNFFANTEMYDERSISTATQIAGKPASGFTKEFLEKIQKNYVPPPSVPYAKPGSKPDLGVTIGKKVTLANNVPGLDYTSIVEDVYKNSSDYYDAFTTSVNTVLVKYGPIISYLYFNPTYRTINNYTFYTDNSSFDISLFGETDPTANFDSSGALIILKNAMEQSIRTIGAAKIFGYDSVLGNATSYADNIIVETLVKITKQKIDDISTTVNKIIAPLLTARNKLILSLDKLNYLEQNYLFDANSGTTQDGSIVSLEKSTYQQYKISGFTKSDFWKEYFDPVNYLADIISFQDLNLFSSYALDFSNPNITNNNIYQILSFLLLDVDENTMFADFDKQKAINLDLQSKMKAAYSNFKYYAQFQKPKTFKNNMVPTRTSTAQLAYGIVEQVDLTDSNLQDQLKKIFSATNKLGATLNLYNHT
jgi:hypothetical protein